MTTITANTITIDEAIIKFRDHLTSLRHPLLTITTYLKDIKYWRAWLQNNSIITKVSDLTRDDLTEYLTHLSKEAPGRPYINSNEVGISANTLKKKLAALKKFAIFLVEAEYQTINITAGIKSPRVPKKEPAFLNQQEYKALLYEAQRRDRPRDYALLMTFLQCGLRESEMVKLALPDVDLLEKRELHLTGRKGGVDTDIPLPTPAVEALSKWLAVRSQVDHDRVFISKTGRPLDERAIRYIVRCYMNKAGIRKQASTHTLRHSFAAWKSAKNVDLKTLQYWMGHKRPETTLQYLHLVKKRAPELMEATSL